MSNVFSDEIGRCFCNEHRRAHCNECCLSFTEVNEMTEIQAGLRAPKTRTQELAESKVMLEQSIAFIMEQDPLTEEGMDANLAYNRDQLERVEEEIKKLEKNERDLFSDELRTEVEKARAYNADMAALSRGLSELNPGSQQIQMGGLQTQQVYERFVAPPPSAQRDQSLDRYTCSYCRKTTTTAMSCCSRCKKQAYCSKECQRLQWNAHKKECVPVEKLSKEDSKKLPLTWKQLEQFQIANGETFEVRFIEQEMGFRLIALCKDRIGVTKRVAAYTESRDIPGFKPGNVMVWKNPRFHYFMDGSSGARIEEDDLVNITIQ